MNPASLSATEQAQGSEPEGTPRTGDIPAFNPGMPIEVMMNFDSVLIFGRLHTLDAGELTVSGGPGTMSLPVIEAGSAVIVRGYDNEMKPVILRAKVLRSTAQECVLNELKPNDYHERRKSVRYPVNPPAAIYAIGDKELEHPEPCKMINVSTGGACVLSEHSYTIGQPLRLQVELVKDGGSNAYECQIRRILPRENGCIEYGLLFSRLDEQKQESLARDLQRIKAEAEKRMLA